MTIKYMLPCECGKHTLIESQQAGETTVCECGRTLEIPTLLQLKKLKQVTADDDLAPKRPTWGAGQSLILLGIVVTLIFLALGIYLVQQVPDKPFSGMTPEGIREEAQFLTPQKAWWLWNVIRKAGLNPGKHRAERDYVDLLAQYRMLWILLTPIFLLGVASLVAGILILRRGAKHPARSERAPP